MIEPHTHNGTDSPNIDFKNLKNFFQYGSSVPTYEPKSPADQFFLYKNGTTERLYVFDFNDNTWKYFTAGAFPTVPDENTILNTDPTLYQWTTFPIIIDASDLGWSITAAGSTYYPNGASIGANTTATAYTYIYGGDGGSGSVWDCDNDIYIKLVAAPQTETTANIRSWFGFCNGTNVQNASDITNTTARFGFAWSGGVLYGLCANGTNVTTASLGAKNDKTWDSLAIYFDGSTCDFYRSGVVTSITTNLPTSAQRLLLGGYNSSGAAAGLNLYHPQISIKFQA